MFGTIVVGLDGSPRQPHVLRQAVRLADLSGGQLVLCRAVLVPPSIPAVVWSLADDQFMAFLIEHAGTEMRRVVEGLPEGMVSSVVCRDGTAAQVLCDVAREVHASLIIVGTHGYDGIDRLLGTTAARVSNLAPCSVLVVRAEAETETEA